MSAVVYNGISWPKKSKLSRIGTPSGYGILDNIIPIGQRKANEKLCGGHHQKFLGIGITEHILDDLEEESYISRYRDGRQNRYEIHSEWPMRHPAQRGLAVRGLLELFAMLDQKNGASWFSVAGKRRTRQRALRC